MCSKKPTDRHVNMPSDINDVLRDVIAELIMLNNNLKDQELLNLLISEKRLMQISIRGSSCNEHNERY